ncbi:PstS family phosphate ABC transporter substrate-binding protein [Candidatus Halobeggiatoa sp. HSG11]|nr:PstS family phosphate ABC transporter substrate-binding protein [Candidatus Halobeggiatoa sp. HSG11]
MNNYKFHFFILCIGLFFSNAYANDIKLPKGLIKYEPLAMPDSIQDQFKSLGSSLVEPIMVDWLEEFQKYYPNITFDIKAGGSGVAIDALLNDKTTFAAMSRQINALEIGDFIEKKGYRPTELRVFVDAVRVIVNRHNPISKLSLTQLDSIFSSSHECGGASYSINTWEEFGWVPKAGALNPIERHIFFEKAGIRYFFRKQALCGGKYKANSNEQATTFAEMTKAVGKSLTAIGFVEMGPMDYSVKLQAIAKYGFYPYYLPTQENISTGKYPLSRYIYVYVDKPPRYKMPLLLQEFFKFVFSQQGQQIVVNHKLIPLPVRQVKEEIQKLLKGR